MSINIESRGGCQICSGKRRFRQTLLCKDCDLWFHPACLKSDWRPTINQGAYWSCLFCKPNQLEETPSQDIIHANDQVENDSPQDENNPPQVGAVITLSNENCSQELSEIQCADEPSSDEDPDEVRRILNYKERRVAGKAYRRYEVLFKNGEKLWLPERDCGDCHTAIADFFDEKQLELPAGIERPDGGTDLNDGNVANHANHVSLERTLEIIKSYGLKGGLEARKFSGLGKMDALFVLQIGKHLFAVLYHADTNCCLIADGKNRFLLRPSCRELVLKRIAGAKQVYGIPFNGQNEEDHCASSAAALAIEFQRLYKNKEWPEEMVVNRDVIKRIRSVLHKQPGPKLNEWQPIKKEQFQLTCKGCGKKFKTQNRGALNLHKC